MSQDANQYLLSKELLRFVYDHREDDVRQLAFHKDKYPEINLSIALDAIQARQKLKKKFPDWAEQPDFFVPHSVMVEQASSLETARYKERFIQDKSWVVLDLSGGLGGDSYALSEKAGTVHYMDISEERTAIAEHNFKVLGRDNVICHSGAAEHEGLNLAESIQPDLIFMDPDRRPEHKGRVFLLEDALPDITELLPRLMTSVPKAELLVKLSPVIDLDYLKERLPIRFDIHMLGVRREAKELILHIHPGASYEQYAVEMLGNHTMILHGTKLRNEIAIQSEIGQYMYDLYPTIAKIGLEHFYPNLTLWKPDRHTHLFFSESLIRDFPGRTFKVLEHNMGDRRWLKQVCKEPLHLVAKNIPVQTDRLRQQFKIREGGNKFLFAFGNVDKKTQYVLAEIVTEDIE
ncbi:SAM-dependent methyltransferase [Porphyromonadaceae bacterium W3.11]|nr:SAM-dependent methyltransferase [Porphyromonadaceae bacterium W3.11]